MYQNEQHAIETLFGKLAAVEKQAAERDPDADAFIRQRLSEQPGAPYYMAQTIVVQEQALAAAQERIDALERRAEEPQKQERGGFLSGLFGGGGTSRGQSPAYRPAGATGYAGNDRPSPWGQAGGTGQAMPGRGGGGFLAGAAQTAMGVAGGVLLGNAIGGMFSGPDAPAAPAPAAEPAAAEPDMDDGGGMDEFEI